MKQGGKRVLATCAKKMAGDWGVSYRDQQPVLRIIFSHLGATFELMLTSTVIAIFIGVWGGCSSIQSITATIRQ